MFWEKSSTKEETRREGEDCTNWSASPTPAASLRNTCRKKEDNEGREMPGRDEQVNGCEEEQGNQKINISKKKKHKKKQENNKRRRLVQMVID